jgi:hypothetical protein
VIFQKKKKTAKNDAFFNPETDPDPDQRPSFWHKNRPDPDARHKINPAGLYLPCSSSSSSTVDSFQNALCRRKRGGEKKQLPDRQLGLPLEQQTE